MSGANRQWIPTTREYLLAILPRMGPDKDGKARREEFEVAYYTKELGRPLQRKLLQRRFDELGDGRSVSAADASSRDDSGDRDRRDESSSRNDRAG